MPRRFGLFLRLWCVGLCACALLALSSAAFASPAARLMRIDPRAGQQNDNPVLTTVIEIAQGKRISDLVRPCASERGNAQLDCMSNALEQPFALYTPFPFPEKQALFMVSVEGSDRPAKLVSSAKWGDIQQTPGVGTAWLILVDADSRMGQGLDDAKQVAKQFIASMGPNDIVDVMFFNDRQVVEDSKWVAAASKAKAQAVIDGVQSTYKASGRNRSLLTVIKNAATDGFKALGNVGENVAVPLHQAMVVLSSGFGGTDPSTTGPGAAQLSQYMTGGRFPEDNTALPKAPVPVISVYLPHKGLDEFRQNSLEFMQNLADPEIGGFFTVVQKGQGERAANIVKAVRTRFSNLYLVKWRVSCIAPTATQSFKLLFNNVKPPVLGDNSFKDVPIGIDPTNWPLDVDRQYTQQMTERAGGVHPGGAFKVYGGFCWGGDKSRAEAYFIPKGQQLPAELSGTDVEQAKRAQQQLIAMDMKGSAIDANDSYVEFVAPDKEKLLHGGGEQAVVRLVIYDSKARRTSGATNSSVLQLKGTKAPLPLLLILGGAFGLVVVLLLIVVLLRSGGKKRGGPPPQAPVTAGGYGAPPGGGYGAPPGPRASSAGATGAHGDSQSGMRATLQGAPGVFAVVPGALLKAGRDSSQCAILLSEPRVSAVHATLKLENGHLMVKDEHSNNGTLLDGDRLTPGAWAEVRHGSCLGFGPVEFSARLD